MSSERTNLLARLAADGGQYILTIAIPPEDRTNPTYGGKASVRFLTQEEYRAIFSGLTWLENEDNLERTWVEKTDANNYSSILSLLGMEEEGNAVEEVQRLVGVEKEFLHLVATGSIR